MKWMPTHCMKMGTKQVVPKKVLLSPASRNLKVPVQLFIVNSWFAQFYVDSQYQTVLAQ